MWSMKSVCTRGSSTSLGLDRVTLLSIWQGAWPHWLLPRQLRKADFDFQLAMETVKMQNEL
jgi:hypothetical protein